jgi:hypothetical protein
MPRQRCSITAGQWLQATGESRRKSADTECIYVASGELNRQRKTVQLAAQIGDDRHIAVAQLEIVQSCRGTPDEQFDRRKTQRLGGS